MDILVVDNNIELCQVLKDFFETQPDLDVVGEAHDGEEALKKIAKLTPDLIILDITMPHLDGLGVLEKMHSLNLQRRPRIIVLTAFGRDDLITRMTDLGVDYFIMKPFNLMVLAERIRQFANDSDIGVEHGMETNHHHHMMPSTDNKEQRITRILHEMGIPPHLKGFTYLRDAVNMYLANGHLAGGLTKELYPTLANRYDTTAGGVEAAIRNAVIAAWEHGNTEYITEMIGTHRANKVPTNSLIIAKLAEEINVS